MVKPLSKAIKAAGGVAALARAIGVTTQAVSQWQRVPAERVLQVVKATNGAVTCHELRPDVFPREAA